MIRASVLVLLSSRWVLAHLRHRHAWLAGQRMCAMHVGLFWNPGVLGSSVGQRYREAAATFVALQRLSTSQDPRK
eukprot:309089-Alexandrium_andersonii.AAC.1